MFASWLYYRRIARKMWLVQIRNHQENGGNPNINIFLFFYFLSESQIKRIEKTF